MKTETKNPGNQSKMKEFMLIIRNAGDGKAKFSAEEQQNFLKACQVYIDELKKNGKLKSAQPLIREGKMISGRVGNFVEGPYHEGNEIVVGYYHIMAEHLDEAVAI